jgi:Flp pilus assembly protein TadD
MIGEQDDVDALYQQGFAALERKDYATAHRAFSAALTISPEDHEIMHGLGVALQGMNRHEDAVVWFRKAIERYSKFPEALVDLGDSLRQLNASGDARVAYESALPLLLPGEATTSRVIAGLQQLDARPM